MGSKRTRAWVAAAGATVVLAGAAVLTITRFLPEQPLAADLPADVFEPPGGPYAVGTLEWLWVDGARPERYTREPGDRRHLLVQAWYPAEQVEGAEPALYIRTPSEFGRHSVYRRAEHVRTHAWTGAPVAGSAARYPVLIYNHGAGWSRFTGTFITETLASHGYVVFSIDHPGRNKTVLFPDGQTFHQDMVPDQPDLDAIADPRERSAAAREFSNAVLFPIWLEDCRFVLDRIEQMDRSPGAFQGRLDLERIGMPGWSFGGAAAMEMSRIDPRVKAAVDHDGGLYGGVRPGGQRLVRGQDRSHEPRQLLRPGAARSVGQRAASGAPRSRDHRSVHAGLLRQVSQGR